MGQPEKKKKSKKAKKEKKEPEPVEEEEEEEEAKPEKKSKKAKKEKKAKEPEPVEEEEEEKPEKVKEKKSKKAKKEKKAKEPEPVEEEEEEKPEKAKKAKRDAEDDETEKSAKKHKKDNSSGITKDFYEEHPDVAAMSTADVVAFRAEAGIEIKCDLGKDYKPLTKFEYTGLSAAHLHSTRNFEKPSPIQAQCWPIILSGRDVVGIAETGSGKSLAFLLPALVHIQAQAPIQQTEAMVLVVAPTRELAAQTAKVADECTESANLRSLCVYGGVPKPPQQKALWKGVHVLVATPGRLVDLMNEGSCSLARVSYLVLDEADRMLDLGFAPEIKRIVAAMETPDRQTLMFSATWPSEVRRIAASFLTTPIRCTIGGTNLAASHNVTQKVEVIKDWEKEKRLQELLSIVHKSRKNRVLIFGLYKKEAARLESSLQRKGFVVNSIHGDKTQYDRTAALGGFKDGTCPLLVATDVAARGLDIPNVEFVINYTFPLTVEDYVHRIGRTGRGGNKGTAYTFFTENEKQLAGGLVNILKDAKQEVPEGLMSFGPLFTKKKTSNMYGAHFDADADMTVKATKITF